MVTFAYAHCDTVCPLIVSEVLSARRMLGDRAPALLIITLDPWRDTPGRLPTMAKSWALDAGAHVLSGTAQAVERTLNAWRIPRTRNQKTGAISHPAIVYVVSADGRIAYAVGGDAATITAAVGAL
jgi:protein SCO1/2